MLLSSGGWNPNPAGRAADERSDIYAVGAVAYLLLSGKRIFHEASGDDLQMRIVHPAAAPLDHPQAVPAALTDLVMQYLAKRMEERPANVAKLMVTLEQLGLSARWSQVEAAQWWENHAPGPDTDKRQEST